MVTIDPNVAALAAPEVAGSLPEIREFARDREINAARRPLKILSARWRANSSTSIQNDSGLPQGPADPSTGRLKLRQTACLQGFG
jgi:hypothetical protein